MASHGTNAIPQALNLLRDRRGTACVQTNKDQTCITTVSYQSAYLDLCGDKGLTIDCGDMADKLQATIDYCQRTYPQDGNKIGLRYFVSGRDSDNRVQVCLASPVLRYRY